MVGLWSGGIVEWWVEEGWGSGVVGQWSGGAVEWWGKGVVG